jgi:hypothetical protein
MWLGAIIITAHRLAFSGLRIDLGQYLTDVLNPPRVLGLRNSQRMSHIWTNESGKTPAEQHSG